VPAGVDLLADEAAGGHTISAHVAKDIATLRQQLAARPNIPAASAFVDLAEAEAMVRLTLIARAADIAAWLSGAGPRGSHAVMGLVHDVGQPVGLLIVRATGQPCATSRVLVAVRKLMAAPSGFIVLTAFPVL
jgi:hypothetical protein